jgi:hypothetical protein
MLAARRIRKIDMADAASADGERDARGDWRPDKPIAVPPFIAWPPPLLATVKSVFGVPGYLWPTNCLWLGLSLVTWFFLTPDLAAMRSFELCPAAGAQFRLGARVLRRTSPPPVRCQGVGR